MKRLAYGGASLVPMAVPTSWRKCLSKDCCFSGWFQVIIQLCGGLRHLGVGCWHVISCSVIQTLCLPHVVCLYSDVTAVTKIAFSGRGERDSRSCRKCLLSRMYEGRVSTRDCM